MSRNRLMGAVVGVAAIGALIWLVGVRGCAGSDKLVAATDEHGRSAAIDKAVTPATHVQVDPVEAPKGRAPRWTVDNDPEGPLRLEGQVVGPDNKGIGGAEVWISSMPQRTATTEADGTFAFDKLVGRSYELGAHSGELIGGPIDVRLSDKTDPAVIRVAAGATLVVTVTDDAKKPIEGAEISEPERERRSIPTDATGVATLKPIRPGWVNVAITKAGYAPNTAFATVGSAGATGTLAVTLHAGYPITGHVVDDTGKPVAKAHVALTTMFGSADKGAETDAKGEFSVVAPAGRHMLAATDSEHAPAESPPVTVIDRAVAGVEITMKSGGTISGTVVDADHKPVAFAAVRAQAVSNNRNGADTFRQVTTDRTGAFAIHGLARTTLQLRAESAIAASKVTTVDLTKDVAKTGIALQLDVRGVISGVVVDSAGAPLPEVQVNAFADQWGGGGTEDVALAGMSSATTDGAGAFVIHGLPDGPYKLWAARNAKQRDWGQSGVSAKVGDTGVRITLASPGSLKGEIRIDGGAAPKLTLVQVGFQAATPVTEGKLAIGDLSPGQYEIAFRGTEFAELYKHDVKIESGKTTDLGTITVMRGRRLTGKVVDGSGNPVAGAKVKVALMLFSVEGMDDQMANFEEQSGVRSAISDTDGAFSVIGLTSKPTNVAAEHPDQGRSTAIAVPEGKDDPPPLTLVLHGFGSIVGKVTMKGEPQVGVAISTMAKGASGQGTFVQTDATGSFLVAKVPEGQVVLGAMMSKTDGKSLKSTNVTVTVVAKKQITQNIDMPVGTLALQVTPKPIAGATLDSAQVFLFAGTIAVANAKQLTDNFLGASPQGKPDFWLGAGKPPVVFDELLPGSYSVCTIPLTGNLQDPSFQQKVQQHLEALKVYCKLVTVTPTPQTQTFVHEVPAMTPFTD